jgi:hypothetical protein
VKKLCFCAAITLCSAAPLNAAVHQHGVGTLQILQAGQDWQFVLQLPASDVVGFEHAPQTQAQLSLVTSAKNTLNDFHRLFALDGKCSVVETVLEIPTDFEAIATDEHEEHSHESDAHEDFRAAYLLKCANRMKTVTFNGFSVWQTLHSIDAQWVTPNRQNAAALSKAQSTIVF